ncbi:hypothetical protein BgiMline_009349, partial [Biomphalaria glabrata]
TNPPEETPLGYEDHDDLLSTSTPMRAQRGTPEIVVAIQISLVHCRWSTKRTQELAELGKGEVTDQIYPEERSKLEGQLLWAPAR